MKHYILLILIVLTSLGCKEDPPDIDDHSLTFNFTTQVNNKDLIIDTMLYQNGSQPVYLVSTLKYFVSNIYAHLGNGDSVFLKATHYVDVSEAGTLDFTTEVGEMQVVAISFVMGIPEPMNTSGMFPNPPENAMEWPEMMGGGYHYMKLEGKWLDINDTRVNFHLHTGPTGGKDYSVYQYLPINVDMTELSGNVELIMHADRWMSGPNDVNVKDMTAIMGNDSIQALIQENGHDVFEIKTLP